MRRFVALFCGEMLTSLTHVLRTVFAGEKINIETLNTNLNGVFLQKVRELIVLSQRFHEMIICKVVFNSNKLC